MSRHTLTQKVSVVKDVLIQNLVEESVLLNLHSEEYFGLDEVGTHMLSILTKSESIQAAYDILLKEYEVEPERLQEDLLGLIDNLVKYGLVEVTVS